jgi:chaperonin GroES
VIAVGPGATDKDGKVVAMSVKAGDRVLLPGWGGNAIKVGEEVCSQCVLDITWLLTKPS